VSDEPIETIELPPTDLDEADLIAMYSSPDAEKPPKHHTVLETWTAVLAPAKEDSTSKIAPQYATNMVAQYPGVGFAEMPAFRDIYFERILTLEEILRLEVESDPECLQRDSAAEDLKYNADHYKNILMQWQLQFLQWELDWDTTDEMAGVHLGALSEVHKMFFGANGLVAYLTSINFDAEYTEADQAALVEALNELKEQNGE
jgi:hypothetical protein